jgi:hypothetical protein
VSVVNEPHKLLTVISVKLIEYRSLVNLRYVSTLDYISSNGRILCDDEFERIWNKGGKVMIAVFWAEAEIAYIVRKGRKLVYIQGIMPEGRINKITYLQETKFLRLFGLTNEHY